jgi:hypothetical protein
MVATRLALALLLRGRPVNGVVQRLRQLTTVAGRDTAWLELALVSRPRLATEQDTDATAEIADQVAVVGAWLGAGLTGWPVRDLGIETQAQLAATLWLTDQPLSTAVRRSWGCSAHELGRRTAVQVLARLGQQPAGPALSLLAMAEALA